MKVRYVLLSGDNLNKWGASFFTLAENLIKEHAVSLGGSDLKYVDIVKDVINLIPVFWIVEEIVSTYTVPSLYLRFMLTLLLGGSSHQNPY
jgi:hypothetical protein